VAAVACKHENKVPSGYQGQACEDCGEDIPSPTECIGIALAFAGYAATDRQWDIIDSIVRNGNSQLTDMGETAWEQLAAELEAFEAEYMASHPGHLHPQFLIADLLRMAEEGAFGG
jgi:hypothetical protein